MTIASVTTHVLHIAIDGNDGWSGVIPAPNRSSTEGPLATLEEAFRRVRSLRKSGVYRGPVEIQMHAGLYTMTETLVVQGDDLAHEDGRLTIRAAGDGEVRIAGGVRLEGFVRDRGGIYKLDLRKAGYTGLRFQQLSCNGVMQHAARYPSYNPENPYGSGWLYVEGPVVSMYAEGHGRKNRFTCRDPRLKTWSRIDEIELFIFPRFNWTNDVIPLQSYDPDTGEVVLSQPATYDIYPGDRFYFRHVREELTMPGEWYLDRDAETLYFYPPESIEDCVVTVPTAGHLFEFRGRQQQGINWKAEKLDWRDSGGYLRDVTPIPTFPDTGFIVLERLTLEECGDAAVWMNGVSGCELHGCTIRNTGGPGVVIFEGKACRVEGCDIHDVGNHGIYMSGGIRSPFEGQCVPGEHEAINNYIHHIGSENKASAGISMNGVGLRAAHNIIHDSPRWGVISRGNDHLIEYNHIRHVNIETSDTAAIYLVDRDFTMRGTRIRYNRIHDILGYHYKNGAWHSPAYAFGIYLDDYTSGVEVFGNLIYRTPLGGVYIHAGQENRIENNVIADTGRELAYCRRWTADRELASMGTYGQALRRNAFRRNVLLTGQQTQYIYSFNQCFSEGKSFDVESNTWEKNVVWAGEERPAIMANGHPDGEERIMNWQEWQGLGFDQGSVAVDPGVDRSEDRFSFAVGSPVWAMGFAPLPVENMGVYEDQRRASWPIVEAGGAREKPLVIK